MGATRLAAGLGRRERQHAGQDGPDGFQAVITELIEVGLGEGQEDPLGNVRGRLCTMPFDEAPECLSKPAPAQTGTAQEESAALGLPLRGEGLQPFT